MPTGRTLAQARHAGYGLGIAAAAASSSDSSDASDSSEADTGEGGGGDGGGDKGGDGDGDKPERKGLGESYASLDKDISKEIHSSRCSPAHVAALGADF